MQYPLGEHEKEKITSRTGKKLTDITLDEVMKNRVSADDIKISKEVLKAQGQVAREAGNDPMEKNFERAAELVDVPDDVILKMYDKLRPNRSTNITQETVRASLWRPQKSMRKEGFCFELYRWS